MSTRDQAFSKGTDTVLSVIGLEIHVQLSTESKLFCGCANRFGDPPNTLICPVCLGLPGALPVLNEKAIDLSIKVGLALNCRVADRSIWDRKSYYYPDLPKNYQISQYDHPLCTEGYLEIPGDTRSGESAVKKIRIRRAHLEEDAGKNVHDNPSHTGVDLNRAGVPLLEIVSEPDLNSPDEVLLYARAVQRLVRWLGAGSADMEKGQMRFEPNVNLHITRKGRIYKTPIVEVKNLNSFRALEATVAYEIERQYDEWQVDPRAYSQDRLGKQNRGYDDDSGITVFQREKEEAHDYRYFPDPDLVPVIIDEGRVRDLRDKLPELPWDREMRYREKYGLAENSVRLLTQERSVGDLFDAAVARGGDPASVGNLLLGKASALANQKSLRIADLKISPAHLSEIANLLAEGKIVSTTASQLLERMIEERRSPLAMAQEDNLLLVENPEQLRLWIEEVLDENPGARNDIIRDGKLKALGYLVGQVMKKSKGTAHPQEVQKLLRARLGI